MSPGVCKEKSSSRGQRGKCGHRTKEEAGNIDIEAGKSLLGMHAVSREQFVQATGLANLIVIIDPSNLLLTC